MQTAAAEVLPRKTQLSILAVLLAISCAPAVAQTAPSPNPPTTTAGYPASLAPETGPAGLDEALRRLQNSGRLMMVTAHPDDEDGGVLTLESRGKGVRCLLMTLTRGEGGQNKTGDTFSDQLGLLRTLELLAADRYYGVEQRFSRVADFGYSKTAAETFEKWGGHDLPLADMVRVIRTFRPDVLVARFSGTERDGHGHHQASAILTKEAFRAAADRNRFPEQIKEGLQAWQAKKLYVGNVCGFGSNACPDENWSIKLNTGEDDPLLGMSYVQFAVEGLKHQTSQGLGDIRTPSGPRYAFYKLEDSVLAKTSDGKGHEKDFFDGIDTSLPGLAARIGEQEKQAPWLRPALEKISSLISDSADALSQVILELHALAEQVDQSHLPASSREGLSDLIHAKSDQATAALNLALNLHLDASVTAAEGPAPLPTEPEAFSPVSPGQRFNILVRLHNGSSHWLLIHDADLGSFQAWVRKARAEPATIGPGENYQATFRVQVPADAPLSRPYWSRENPETDSVYRIDNTYQTWPLPPNSPQVSVQYSIAPQHGLRPAQPMPRGARITANFDAAFADTKGDPQRLPLAIVPAFSVALEPGEQVIPLSDGKTTTVKVGVNSNLTGAPQGRLRLELPAGWRAEPDSREVEVSKRGDRQEFSFTVFPSKLAEGRSEIRAVLEAGGRKYGEGYKLVTRNDLGSFYYYQPAVQRISIVDVNLPRNLKVGYIMGAGDDIASVLRQIGMNVALIPADKIAGEDLSQYGTVVLGVRAYDTQKELVANNKKLLDFVSGGGTLVVQNNNSVADFNNAHLTPYAAELSRARVSVEEAPVRILAPDEPVLRYPNKISPRDFDGWVQERGLYFMSSWEDHFRPLLACHDPDEPDQKGGLLIAKYGQGTYIYAGYAFFRQLPAGVPGAVRLFVNLVSAGHEVAGR
jgi:LmbE family N-acetylglucosaminyl deacetylase